MQVKFTARRFRAHAEVKDHAISEVKKLARFYDGIIRADVILSYERATKSVKAAEVNMHVYGVVLSAKEKSDNFIKSIDLTVQKLGMQLSKYKNKMHAKDKQKVRALREKV
jgi:ribosomal subunit interface protein